MKSIKQNYLIRTLFLGLLFLVNSCETTKLEILDDPDAVSLSQADLNFFLNSNQFSLGTVFEGTANLGGFSEFGMEATRMIHMNGPLYQNAFDASDLDTQWEKVYATIISNNRALEPVAVKQKAFQHLGIAQIIEAYVMATLVDYFGDVPYSQAVNGTSNPSRDPGDVIYGELLKLLDEAISNLNKTSSITYSSDIFYNGDSAKWIKFANTLKLKLYLQTRLLTSGESTIVNSTVSTTGINAIIASGNYITSATDDFTFKWSTNDVNPDSRHPIFARNFDSPGIITDYMSNHYMTELNAGFASKTVKDPRLRYYIYRQKNRNANNTVEQDCFGSLPPAHYGFSIPFCTTKFNGYWGRDHGDNSGIPPDTGSRATWGVYPVGGVFDNDSFKPIVSRNVGKQGAGISPIMLSSYVNFMLAESALTLGTTGDASTYLRNGITQSIEKVMSIGSSEATPNFTPTQANIDAYINEVMTNYMNASQDEKLNIIITEYYLALFGNGVEAYNSYRRTGKPSNLQPLRVADVNTYIRSFFYPTSSVSNNSNSNQKATVTQKVFWDNNPDSGFIN